MFLHRYLFGLFIILSACNKQDCPQELEANIYSHLEINEAIGQTGEKLITPALISFLKNCFR